MVRHKIIVRSSGYRVERDFIRRLFRNLFPFATPRFQVDCSPRELKFQTVFDRKFVFFCCTVSPHRVVTLSQSYFALYHVERNFIRFSFRNLSSFVI